MERNVDSQRWRHFVQHTDPFRHKVRLMSSAAVYSVVVAALAALCVLCFAAFTVYRFLWARPLHRSQEFRSVTPLEAEGSPLLDFQFTCGCGLGCNLVQSPNTAWSSSAPVGLCNATAPPLSPTLEDVQPCVLFIPPGDTVHWRLASATLVTFTTNGLNSPAAVLCKKFPESSFCTDHLFPRQPSTLDCWNPSAGSWCNCTQSCSNDTTCLPAVMPDPFPPTSIEPSLWMPSVTDFAQSSGLSCGMKEWKWSVKALQGDEFSSCEKSPVMAQLDLNKIDRTIGTITVPAASFQEDLVANPKLPASGRAKALMLRVTHHEDGTMTSDLIPTQSSPTYRMTATVPTVGILMLGSPYFELSWQYQIIREYRVGSVATVISQLCGFSFALWCTFAFGVHVVKKIWPPGRFGETVKEMDQRRLNRGPLSSHQGAVNDAEEGHRDSTDVRGRKFDRSTSGTSPEHGGSEDQGESDDDDDDSDVGESVPLSSSRPRSGQSTPLARQGSRDLSSLRRELGLVAGPYSPTSLSPTLRGRRAGPTQPMTSLSLSCSPRAYTPPPAAQPHSPWGNRRGSQGTTVVVPTTGREDSPPPMDFSCEFGPLSPPIQLGQTTTVMLVDEGTEQGDDLGHVDLLGLEEEEEMKDMSSSPHRRGSRPSSLSPKFRGHASSPSHRRSGVLTPSMILQEGGHQSTAMSSQAGLLQWEEETYSPLETTLDPRPDPSHIFARSLSSKHHGTTTTVDPRRPPPSPSECE